MEKKDKAELTAMINELQQNNTNLQQRVHFLEEAAEKEEEEAMEDHHI